MKNSNQTEVMLTLKYGSMFNAYTQWLVTSTRRAKFTHEETETLLDWRIEYAEKHPEFRRNVNYILTHYGSDND